MQVKKECLVILLLEDSITKKKNFEIDVNNLGYSINFGGRFIHLSYDYDKGVAVEKFFKPY